MPKAKTREKLCLIVTQILRDERKRQGISMERLAGQAGLSTSMISLVERDLRNPTLDTLLRITEVLELDLGKVLLNAARQVRKEAVN